VEKKEAPKNKNKIQYHKAYKNQNQRQENPQKKGKTNKNKEGKQEARCRNFIEDNY
jgi:hypothetical protein